MTVAAKRKTQQKSEPAEKKPTSVPRALRAEVDSKAKNLIAKVLKPKHVRPPVEDNRFSYLTGIETLWEAGQFYFVSICACPWPKALEPSFRSRFARLEYVGHNQFALSYLRVNGQWRRAHEALTVTQCMKIIRDDPRFAP